MSEIRFHKPWLNKTPPEMVVINFPFDIIITTSNVGYDKKYYKEITVSITAILVLGIWGYKEVYEQEKVLFQFALDKIKSLSHEELINEEINIFLTEGNQAREKPYNPDKIPNPDGFTISIDDNYFKQKNKIGF